MKEVAFYWSSKVIYNAGKGGGYHSLLVYRRALMTQFSTTLIHYNELNSKTILDDYVDILLLPTDTFIKKYRRLNQYFKERQPEAIFAFTSLPSTLLFRWMCWLHNSKFIYVRAGGPNYSLKQYYVNVLFFHNENLKALGKNRCEQTFLISNRVDAPEYNVERIAEFKNKHAVSADTLKILRVSRVNQAYLPVFMATIRQHETLLRQGKKVLTHLIGVVQDTNAYQTIQKAIENVDGIGLFTEDYYTDNTKELIPFYDVVVGIGRGFWEGVAYDKLVVGFAENVPLPVLVTQDNIDTFLEYNCSPRVKLDRYVTYADVVDKPDNSYGWTEYKGVLQQTFDLHFSSVNLASKLTSVIERSAPESIWELFKSLRLVYTTKLRAIVGGIKNQLIDNKGATPDKPRHRRL